MKIVPGRFLAPPGSKIDLSEWPAKMAPFYHSKTEYKTLLDAQKSKLEELQGLLYAHNRYAMLIVFQAMDAAGKDSAIKHVMSGVNPQGCEVHSFTHPSTEELKHDFLWRAYKALPSRGRIGIFNRSHYEEVLIVRVHPEILVGESLPEELTKQGSIWRGRFRSILEFENHLHRNGTQVLKFFLHVSREEQRKRFLKRIDDPEKNWKFNAGDLEERKLWKSYMEAYEECLSATSTPEAPWYIVPADDKKNTRLIVAQTIVETMSRLKMSYPRPSASQLQNLKSLRQLLKDEKS